MEKQEAANVPIDRDRWMTIGEVAEYLQLGRSTIYELVRQGNIPGAKVAGRWRFKRNELDEWVKSRQGQKPGAPVEES